MSVLRVLLTVAVGLLLGTMPWWRYATPGAPAEAHADHAPRYGGQVGMTGDHHVELVWEDAWLEVHVSDAWRRPVRPVAAYAVLDGTRRLPLRWKGHRFVGDAQPGATEIETVVTLADHTRLAISFHVPGGPDTLPRAPR